MTLSEAQINTIVDQLVPPGRSIRANADNAPSGTRIVDNRGKVFTHGWAQRTAFDAGTNPAVIGGIYMANDNRLRTAGWDPIKDTASGDDCLKIGTNASNGHFYLHGVVLDSTHDAIAPGKGIESNRSRTTYHIEHCYARMIRDETFENDASLRGKSNDCLFDNTWMMYSLRNPNVQMDHKGFTELDRILCRFACQPDSRDNKSGCAGGFSGGGLIFKAGPDTGSATYKNSLFLWEARHNRNAEEQSWRPGATYQNVYVIFAPQGVPRPFFDPLPSGVVDLGVHDNSYEVWLRARDRWLVQHDCRPKDNYFGLTLKPGQAHPSLPNLVVIPQTWSYNYGPRAGAGSGDPPPPGTPDAPTNTRATAVEQSRVVLAWNAVTGTSIRYLVKRNGATLASNLTATSYEDTTVQPNTGYSYEVLAVNTAANLTSEAASVSVTTPGDIGQPGEYPVKSLPLALDTNNPKGRILKTLVKPANAVQAQLSLTGFDFDAAEEARVTINRTDFSSQTITLFGAQAAGDQIVSTLSYQVPPSAFLNGENAFDFDWLGTVGSRIDAIDVTFQTEGGVVTPPVAPTLTVGVVEARKVNLSWNNVATSGRTIIYVLRRNGATIATLASLSYQDQTVEPQTTYSYTVQAVDTPNNQSSPLSTAIQVTTPQAGVANQAPTVPTGLAAPQFGPDFVQLQWNASIDVDGTVARYQVRRNGTLVQEPNVTNYRDQGLLPDTLYSYTVLAVDNLGLASGQSGTLSVRTLVGDLPDDPLPPTTPQNLRTALIEAHRVTLAWNPSTDPDGTIRSYVVRRNGSVIDETVNTFFTDTTVQADTTYAYTVQAVDDDQQVSGMSSPLTVTVPPAPVGMTKAQLEERLTKLELVLEDLADIFAQIEEKLRRVQELPDEVC